MEYKLKDLINISHGYAFKGKDFSEKPTNEIVLTPGNVNIGGGLKLDKIKYLKEDSSFDTSYIFNENDIFVTMTDLSKAGDTLGYPAFIPKANDIRFLHNQRLGRIIIKDTKKIDKTYLYYLMCNQSYRNYILSTATGSTVKHTSPKTILNYKVDLPTLSKQKIIGHVLKSIDKKIENNIRIITNLEELAQTLFKRWFVDFEFPDENGNPYKSSGGKLIDTSLGYIPFHFKVGKIEDICTLKYGKALPKKERTPGSYPVYGSGGVTGTHNEFLIRGPGIIIGRKGTIGTVYKEYKNFFPIDTVFYIESELYPIDFLYQLFLSLNFKDSNSDSAVPGLNRGFVHQSQIVIPSLEITLKFNEEIDRFSSMIFQKKEENRNLIKLRDTLLPQLMSGELELSEELEV